MKWYACLLVSAIVIGCGSFLYADEQADTRPNIILIMVDDQGWADAGYQGHPDAVTPTLDAMAAQGLVFDRFYAAAPVCSPTRGSVMTGRHPYRYGIYFANVGHLLESEPNLARILRDEGYRTGMFGKWHLGTLTTRVHDANRGGPGRDTHYAPPWQRGFDVCFATESKVPTYDPLIRPRDFNSHPGNLREWWDPVKDPEDAIPFGTRYWDERGREVTDNVHGPNARVIMDRVIDFIDGAAAKEQPFFAMVWFHEPHLPVVAGDRYREPFQHLNRYAQHYWGCLMAMDEQISRMRARLRELGIEGRTMIWYTSDNGPEDDARSGPGSAGDLRGRKRDLYEGGIRVPGIVEWPGVIQPGRTQFAAVTSDYLPTIVEMLDLDLANDHGLKHELDGISLMPVLADRSLEREQPIGFMSQGRIALIGQRYKIVDHHRRGGHWPSADPQAWNLELYDLVEDHAEQRNLAEQMPERVERMRETLAQWYASVRRDNATD